MRSSSITISALTAVALATFSLSALHAEWTDDPGAIALSGHVRSADEGAMEGVLVSARADGSTVTTTVVSDATGQFSFPAARLGPGHYALRIRAAGYDLQGPAAVAVGARRAIADLTLRKTKDLAPQLTDAEWLASIPGTETQKRQLLGCTNCHTLERVLRSTHNAEEFGKVLERMASYANQSFRCIPSSE